MGGKRFLVVGALGAATLYRSTVFVPPPSVKSTRAAQLSTAACAAALFGAENAHADAIGDAAAKLSKAAYPFMKEVPWNSYLYATKPGSADAVSWTKAIGKMIDMGAAMDTKLPTSKVMDVYNAMASIIGSSPVPNYLYSSVKPQDAQAAYNALIEFKDVVKAASR